MGGGGGGGGGAGRPPVAQKPSYLTGGAGPTGHLNAKRGTEDLDFFIGDEALAQASGPGIAPCPTVVLWAGVGRADARPMTPQATASTIP